MKKSATWAVCCGCSRARYSGASPPALACRACSSDVPMTNGPPATSTISGTERLSAWDGTGHSELEARVEDGLEEVIRRRPHQLAQAGVEPGQFARVGGVAGQVLQLAGIDAQVIQLSLACGRDVHVLPGSVAHARVGG